MMRLSGPGGREQIDICLAKLRDPAKTGNLANLVTFNETPALEAFLAKPRISMKRTPGTKTARATSPMPTQPSRSRSFSRRSMSLSLCAMATCRRHARMRRTFIRLSCHHRRPHAPHSDVGLPARPGQARMGQRPLRRSS